MNNYNEIAELAAILAIEFKEGKFDGDPVRESVRVTSILIRNANTLQRLGVTSCNRELSEAEKRADKNAEDRIKEACAPHGIVASFSGDIRGAVVKIKLSHTKRSNSMEGDRWCIPTRSY